MKNQPLSTMSFNSKGDALRTLSPFIIAALVALLNLALASAADAAVAVLSYWRIGEFDPGANAGTTAPNAIDTVGSHSLKITGPAYYSNDVAIAALAHASSSLSLN